MLPRFLLACTSLLPAACTGPATHLHDDGGHRVFVDGIEVAGGQVAPSAADGQVVSSAGNAEVAPATAGERAPLPFRYYGVGRWDADPADRDGRPDWLHLPAGGPIAMPAPASPWWFPLDFPIELARRWFEGRRDHHVQIVLPPAPDAQRMPAEVPATGLAELVDRAAAARVAR